MRNENVEWFIFFSFTFMLAMTCIGVKGTVLVCNDIIAWMVAFTLVVCGFTGWYMQLRKVLPN